MKNYKVITLAYLRVSTKEQNLERQITAIKGFRPDIDELNIYSDKQSGKQFNREGYNTLKALIKQYRKAFSKEELVIELVIEELDRLGRNYQGIMEELRWFQEQGVILRILEIPMTLQEVDKEQRWILEMTLNIIIEVYARIAEQELEKRYKRQMEGIAEAKKEGIKFGRTEIEIDVEQFSLVAGRAIAGEITHTAAMGQLGLKRNTYYRRLEKIFPNYKN
jgi:DNA invertase Pin-like site-specific DNA recombinase